jgi:hypothetical protein
MRRPRAAAEGVGVEQPHQIERAKKYEGNERMKSQRINSTNSSLYLRAMVFLLAAVCVLGCSPQHVKASDDSAAQATFVSPGSSWTGPSGGVAGAG